VFKTTPIILHVFDSHRALKKGPHFTMGMKKICYLSTIFDSMCLAQTLILSACSIWDPVFNQPRNIYWISTVPRVHCSSTERKFWQRSKLLF